MARTLAADWLGIALDHPFGLQTLPYGSFTTRDRPTDLRSGVAVGDRVLDLTAATYRLYPGRADLFSAWPARRVPRRGGHGMGPDPHRDQALAHPR